LAVYNTF